MFTPFGIISSSMVFIPYLEIMIPYIIVLNKASFVINLSAKSDAETLLVLIMKSFAVLKRRYESGSIPLISISLKDISFGFI